MTQRSGPISENLAEGPRPGAASEPLTIVAADGRALAARWWSGAQASTRCVIFLPGLAAPQAYFRSVAGYLAHKGWGVLSFDYRSVGGSRDAASDRTVTLDDWVNQDLPAAEAEARRRSGTKFLAVIAHSIGGQLFGQSEIRHTIDAALFISAQRGIPRLYSGRSRVRIEYAYLSFSVLIHALGYLPVSKATLPETCSGQALLQWISWGRKATFTDTHGVNVERRFADYSGPLTAITIADDDDYAPARAVEALTSLYTGARVRREVIQPKDFSVNSLGHFGFFHPRAPRKLWAQTELWLRTMEEDAGRRH